MLSVGLVISPLPGSCVAARTDGGRNTAAWALDLVFLLGLQTLGLVLGLQTLGLVLGLKILGLVLGLKILVLVLVFELLSLVVLVIVIARCLECGD